MWNDIVATVLTRENVIALAVLGGLFSIPPTFFKAKMNAVWTLRLGQVSYVFMGLSMLVFVLRGLLT
jgi:hypothetical protein